MLELNKLRRKAGPAPHFSETKSKPAPFPTCTLRKHDSGKGDLTTISSHSIDKIFGGTRDSKQVRKGQARDREASQCRLMNALHRACTLALTKSVPCGVGPGMLLRKLLIIGKTEQKGWEVGQETLQPAACLYDGLTPILEILFLIVKKDGEIIPHEISCPLSF
jgi:hypothetical protein